MPSLRDITAVRFVRIKHIIPWGIALSSRRPVRVRVKESGTINANTAVTATPKVIRFRNEIAANHRLHRVVAHTVHRVAGEAASAVVARAAVERVAAGKAAM